MLGQLFAVFLSGVHLKVHDVAIVLGNLFIVTDINLFSTLRNQTHVVGNHQDTTLKAIETTGQRIDGLNIYTDFTEHTKYKNGQSLTKNKHPKQQRMPCISSISSLYLPRGLVGSSSNSK
jgi:hypothetical protein